MLFNKQLFSSLDLCRRFPTEISNFEAFDDVIDDVISHDPFVATPLFNKQLLSNLVSVGVFQLRYQIIKLLMTSYRMTVLQPPVPWTSLDVLFFQLLLFSLTRTYDSDLGLTRARICFGQRQNSDTDWLAILDSSS